MKNLRQTIVLVIFSCLLSAVASATDGKFYKCRKIDSARLEAQISKTNAAKIKHEYYSSELSRLKEFSDDTAAILKLTNRVHISDIYSKKEQEKELGMRETYVWLLLEKNGEYKASGKCTKWSLLTSYCKTAKDPQGNELLCSDATNGTIVQSTK